MIKKILPLFFLVASGYFLVANSSPVFAKIEDICKNTANKAECEVCVRPLSQGGKGGAWTALGCIPANGSGFIAWIFGPLLGIIGGIAFLLILWGGFTIITSTGDPQRITHGREIITSALAGLLLIIFSVFILRLIGVDILAIPGFK